MRRGFGQAGPYRRDADDVLRIVIDELEPILGNIRGRENVVLDVFRIQRTAQIGFADPLRAAGCNRPFDGHGLRPFHDGGDDRPAHEVAPVKQFLAPAAERHFDEAVLVAARELPFQEALHQALHGRLRAAGFRHQLRVVGQIRGEIDFVDFARPLAVGPVHLDLAVDAARSQDRGVDQIRPIAGEDDHHVVERLDAVHLRAKHRHERGKNVRIPRSAPRPEHALGLVDEQEREKTVAPLFARRGEDFAHDPFALSHPHVQNLRPFDVHETFPHGRAALLRKHGGQVVSRGLSDERFAASGRAVEQESLGGLVLEAGKQFPVQQRQLHGVLDRRERLLLPAHFFPRQLRHRVQVVIVRL